VSHWSTRGVTFDGTYHRNYGGRPKKRGPAPKPKWKNLRPFGEKSLSVPVDEGQQPFTGHPATAPPAKGRKPKRPSLNAVKITDKHVFEAAKAAREHIEQGRLARVGGKFKRHPGETRAARYISSVRLDFVSAELLKLHAFQRRVHLTTLISDILNGWLDVATDYKQALFRECLPEGVTAASTPERFVGYLASLGFRPLYQFADAGEPQTVNPVAEQPPAADPAIPPIVIEKPITMADVVPPMTPIGAQTPPEEPDPMPEPPPAPPTGWGSAAQAYMLGMDTGAVGPVEMMERENERRVEELRADAAARRREHGIPDEQYGARPDGKTAQDPATS